MKAMRKIGYIWDRTSGSHMILIHPTRNRLSVPRHRELGRGILRSLIHDADLSVSQFLELL
ncbi:MAG: type II toxin-antitoxin system HicA family toxin [Dehalococcoidia bacterium]|nr:type II toxin-antitoxin system HicA family toxin [Chloroflexota bacterium]MCZ6867853.1 type II toxin-antitoxin system HicA family toxin [Chloroflexota bacterium]